MFNKIIVSVVSSAFMFACSVKDSSDGGDVTSAADVVSSEALPVPEVVNTTSTVQPATSSTSTTPAPAQPTSLPAGEATGGASQPAVNPAVLNSSNTPTSGAVTASQPIAPVSVPTTPSTTVK